MNRCATICITAALVSGLQAPAMFAQQTLSLKYELEPTSRLWLEGTATVGDYTCQAGLINGIARLQVSAASNGDASPADTTDSEVKVSIPVKNLECGNSAMNADMYNAMKADSFPSILYELIDATIISKTDSLHSIRRVRTNGRLTIAGVTKIVPMLITIVQLSPTRFRITGSKTLSMHDFDITPPTTLWGLIQAHDQLVVRFDLFAKEQ